MKRILRCAMVLFISYSGFSQVDILTETTWYLRDLSYNGVDYEPPSGDPQAPSSLVFDEQGGQFNLSTAITIDSFFCLIDIDESNETFTTTNPAITLFGCESFCDLESAYFEFYFKDGNPVTFEYSIGFIDSQEPQTILFVEDEFGNRAFYSDLLLSVDDVAKPLFTIYPNPSSETVFITSEGRSLEKIRVFNTLGETIFAVVKPENSLDVSGLSEGLYFIEINSEGKKSIQKFIKN